MKIRKTVEFSVPYYIGTIVFIVLLILAALLGYFSLQLFIFGRGEYLLFVSKELSIVPVIMIVVLITQGFIIIKDKLLNKKKHRSIEENDETIDVRNLSRLQRFIFKLLKGILKIDGRISKVSKVIKVCYIPALILALYLGMTSYAILYTDSIKVSSPIVPAGVIYEYSDVKNISVGVSKGYGDSYTPYYKVKFNDGKSVDLFGGTMHEDKGVGFEHILIDLDTKLRAQGVTKTVDKDSFEKYSRGLNKEFISRVEKLFNDK